MERATKRRKAPSRNDQVIRVISILRELRRVGGADLYELAERYGTSVRTVRRDLEAIEQAGVRLKRETNDETNRRRWVLHGNGHDVVSESLDADHYLALRMAMDEAQALRQFSSLYAALEELSGLIEAAVGPRGRARLADIDSACFSCDKFPWQSSPPDVLRLLVDAIARKSICCCAIADCTGIINQAARFLPLRVFAYDGAVHVHAWCLARRRLTTVNLQHVSGFRVLDETMSQPPSYNAEAFEQSTFSLDCSEETEHFVLRFDAFAATRIADRRWHPTQALRRCLGGGLELSFRCARTPELVQWIASWMNHVEVLEPKSLRVELGEIAQHLTSRYLAEGAGGAIEEEYQSVPYAP
jgi:predicted DNA-binding transcriptional regulator YafY